MFVQKYSLYFLLCGVVTLMSAALDAPLSVPAGENLTQNKSPLDMPLVGASGRIRIGGSLSLSGVSSFVGGPYQEGFMLAMDVLNREKKGIQGRFQVDVDVRDDGGSLARAIGNIESVRATTSLLLPLMSDELFDTYLAPFFAQGLLSAPLALVGTNQRSDSAPFLFRPSYEDEVTALILYARTVLQRDKIAFFYEDSDWGTSVVSSAEATLGRFGARLCAKGAYQPGTVNVSAALDQIKKSEPQVIICIANGLPAYTFIREAINQGLHYATFMGISRVGGVSEHVLASRGRGVSLLCSAVVPDPERSTLPLVARYRADMKRLLPNKKLTVFGLEGYLVASLFSAAAEKLSLPQATIRDFLGALENLRGSVFEGIPLTSSRDRDARGGKRASSQVFISLPGGEWPVYTAGVLQNGGVSIVPTPSVSRSESSVASVADLPVQREVAHVAH